MPADHARAEAFGPGADLRSPRALPVLIVAAHGPGELAAAIRELILDLAGPVIGVGEIPGAGEPLDTLAGHCVALLNRGIPGCLVTPDGTLNISLMRSSSAWPSAVWIDGERRTAPDGSSFTWQHWSHTFEYALAAGPGDWRSAGFAAAGEDYNHDLIACQTGAHDGPLPAEASLGSVDPPEVTLTALKPLGNPLAAGRPAGAAPGVLARLRETTGRPARARVRLAIPAAGAATFPASSTSEAGTRPAGDAPQLAGPGPGPARLIRARRTDLLEEAEGEPLAVEDGAALVDLPSCGLASLAFDFGPAPSGQDPAARGHAPAVREQDRSVPDPGAAARQDGSGAEPAQPVYTRYWLHGKGPAPAGNLPVAVHIRPGRAALGQGPRDRVRFRVTVACGPEPARGQAGLDVPDGLVAEPAGPLEYDLPARGHAAWDVTVTATPGARQGRHFVAARIRDGLGQLLEDAALVTVGQPGPPDLSLPLDELLPLIEADQQALAGEIGLALPADELSLAPGERGELAVSISNQTGSQVRGEAQLVSPYGSWNVIGPWTLGFAADPGGEVTLSCPVCVPASARPGAEWWALFKIMYFGRVRYTRAVRLMVTG